MNQGQHAALIRELQGIRLELTALRLGQNGHDLPTAEELEKVKGVGPALAKELEKVIQGQDS